MLKNLIRSLIMLFLSMPVFASASSNNLIADFAYGIPITTTPDQVLYKFLLPLSVYQGVVYQDLRDIRVLNVQGESVPYSIRFVQTVQQPVKKITLPLFPIYGVNSASSDNMSLHVERNQQGAILQVTTNNQPKSSQEVSAYLVDASSIKAPIQSLQLTLPTGQTSFIRSVNVQYSDDLKQWQTAVENAPIASLKEQDNTLEHNEITINNQQAKYFRISWPATDNPLHLSQVTAALSQQVTSAEPHQWLTLNASADKPVDTWLFDAKAYLPVDTARVIFPKKNDLLQVQLFSRNSIDDKFRYQQSSLVYQLQNTPQNRSLDISLRLNTDRYWQIKTANQLPQDTAPQLSLGWVPQELVFIAKGEGPYTLVYGNAAATAVSFKVDEMITQLEKQNGQSLIIARANLGEQKLLGGDKALQPLINWKQWLLWTVLIVGTLLIIWMAARLFKQMDN